MSKNMKILNFAGINVNGKRVYRDADGRLYQNRRFDEYLEHALNPNNDDYWGRNCVGVDMWRLDSFDGNMTEHASDCLLCDAIDMPGDRRNPFMKAYAYMYSEKNPNGEELKFNLDEYEFIDTDNEDTNSIQDTYIGYAEEWFNYGLKDHVMGSFIFEHTYVYVSGDSCSHGIYNPQADVHKKAFRGTDGIKFEYMLEVTDENRMKMIGKTVEMFIGLRKSL
jgi:hypothetical protein